MTNARRKQVYQRDGGMCLKCGTSTWLTIDHIVPKSVGGCNSMVNLQTLCKPCNLKKGARIECLNGFRRSENYARKFEAKMWV